MKEITLTQQRHKLHIKTFLLKIKHLKTVIRRDLTFVLNMSPYSLILEKIRHLFQKCFKTVRIPFELSPLNATVTPS